MHRYMEHSFPSPVPVTPPTRAGIDRDHWLPTKASAAAHTRADSLESGTLRIKEDTRPEVIPGGTEIILKMGPTTGTGTSEDAAPQVKALCLTLQSADCLYYDAHQLRGGPT